MINITIPAWLFGMIIGYLSTTQESSLLGAGRITDIWPPNME